MDTFYYRSLVVFILNITKKTQSRQVKNLKKNLFSLIQTHGKDQTKKEIDYLTNVKSILSLFYDITKTYKNQTTNEFLHTPAPLKIRLIIAGPSCKTHPLSCRRNILRRPYLELHRFV